jgi:hypothetical protein
MFSLIARYKKEKQFARNRLQAESQLFKTSTGLVEAALAGQGSAVLISHGGGGGFDRILPLMAVAIVTSDVAIAAMAFRNRLGVAVVARSVVEPWTLAIVALLMAFTPLKRDGLLIAYAASMVAAMIASGPARAVACATAAAEIVDPVRATAASWAAMTARSLRKTLESIATPCSVKA